MQNDYVRNLRKRLTGEVEDNPDTLEEFSTDASLFKVRPTAVTFPKDVEDVQTLVRYVSENKEDMPELSLTARSAGTCMSGGPLNDSLIVEFTRHFDRESVDPDNLEAEVQPGVYYHDFENMILPQNISMPVYPASKSIAATGGMIMNNCGGEKTLRYGQMRDFVNEIDVVLADGNEYTFGPISKEELEAKMEQDNFEGDVYRKTFKLLDENYDLVKQAKPRTSKNSAGYALWEVWDKEEGVFDLSQLFVGSQGTLGILTDARVRLIEQPKHRRLATLFMKNWDELPELINDLLEVEPESLETFDDETMKLGLRFMPQIAEEAGENLLSFASQFTPELKIGMKMMGMPKLVVMAEFAEDDESVMNEKLNKLPAIADAYDGVYLRIPKEGEGEKYWTMRRKSFSLLRESVGGKRTAPFIDDICVQPKDLPDVLPKVLKILEDEDIDVTLAGHAGSGNFHIIPLMDLTKEEEKEKIPRISKKVYKIIIEHGGTITAEHNDGLIRSPFLEDMYGEEVYDLFKKVKDIFDPQNIFNPGKKVNADFESAMDHIASKE